jgi:hypothetical protein
VLFLLAVVSLAAGIDLSSFRQSYARAIVSHAGLQFDWQNSRRQQAAITEDRDELDLRPYASWASIMRSDEADLDISVETGLWLESQQELMRLPEYLPGRNINMGWDLTPEATWRSYLFGSDAFVQAHGGLSGEFGTTALDDTSARHLRASTWHGGTHGAVAIGYGRMRDAEPLAKAVRITEILREEEVLEHDLSDDELRELAGFISRSWKISWTHDYFYRHYYDSLSSYLTRTRAISRPLPAYVLFRLSEYEVGSFARPFGWRVAAQVDGSVSYEVTNRSEFGNKTVERDSDGSGGSAVTFECAKLLGLRTILSAEMVYRPPWPVALAGWYRHIATAYVAGRYMVADRLSTSLTARYSPTYSIPYSPWLTRQLEHRGKVEADVRYYLADRFYVSGNAGWSGLWWAEHIDGQWVPRMPSRSLQLGVDIRWGPDSRLPNI